MFPADPTGELSRQRIADLHAEADSRRLARSVLARPAPRTTVLRQLITTVVLAAVPVVVLTVETAGRRNP